MYGLPDTRQSKTVDGHKCCQPASLLPSIVSLIAAAVLRGGGVPNGGDELRGP